MTTPSKEKGTGFNNLNTQGKTLLSALVGAIIGSCASLHIYHTLLGGADQAKQITQLETTAEHTRQTTDELLARHGELLAKLDSGEFFQKGLQAQIASAKPIEEMSPDELMKHGIGLALDSYVKRTQQQGDKPLSSKPTQRELDDALNGMFEDVADIPATEAAVASDVDQKNEQAKAVVPAEQENAPVEAGAKAVEDGGSASASDEAAK